MCSSLLPLFSSIRSSAATILLSTPSLTPASGHVALPLGLAGVASLSFALVILLCWISLRGHRR